MSNSCFAILLMSKSLSTSKVLNFEVILSNMLSLLFTPQPLRAVGVLFSPMVSGWAGGWAGGRAAGNSLSGLYLRNRKV